MTRNPPQTSAVPSPTSIFVLPTSLTPQHTMTETSTAGPTPTPLPDNRKKGDENKKSEETNNLHDGDDPEDKFPHPKLRLQFHDITHPGAARFLSAVDASTILSQCVETVLKLLYISNRHECKSTHPRPIPPQDSRAYMVKAHG